MGTDRRFSVSSLRELEMKATAGGTKQGVTGAQMREAERGLKIMLGAKFPKAWIGEHSREVLGQAHVEYQEWLKTNAPARNPVGWLCICAYRRAQNLRDSERRRPKVDPLDTVFHLADERAPTPEQEAIDRDRERRLRKALSHLPEKEVKLLALVYFEDNSIREAGRKLGWQKSAADRHHNTAMEKLRALVGDDRSLFSPATLGLAAYLATRGEWGLRRLDSALTPGREAVAIVAELGSSSARRLGELARSLSPLSDASAAAASSGAGRTVGVCGAGLIALVCVGAASVVGPGPNDPQRPHRPGGSRQAKGPMRPPARIAPPVTTAQLSTPELPEPEPARRSEPARLRAAQRPLARERRAPTSAPQATSRQVQDEFGIESGLDPAPQPAPAPKPDPLPQSPVTSPPDPPASSRPESSQSSGSSVSREFGL